MISLGHTDIKQAVIAASATAVLGAGLLLVWDPTASDRTRLQTINDSVRRLPKPVATSDRPQTDITALMQAPIFVMSTGPTAYREAPVKLLGLAISPGRKAALVSIDGGPEQWMRVNELQGDIRLLEVGPRSVRFDTPVGIRTVDFSAEAVAAQAASQ